MWFLALLKKKKKYIHIYDTYTLMCNHSIEKWKLSYFVLRLIAAISPKLKGHL
jgi:hypothetical protein